MVPGGRGVKVRRVLHRMNEAVSGFIRGRLLIAVITSTGFAVGWTWTDVPYSLLLGIVTGVLTIVPYLSIVGWPIALFVKYLDAASSGGTPTWPEVVLWPSVVFILVAFLEGWVLTPWIQSRTMEMSALTVLLAVLDRRRRWWDAWIIVGDSIDGVRQNYGGRAVGTQSEHLIGGSSAPWLAASCRGYRQATVLWNTSDV
jgi:Predicted permease